MEVAGHEFPHLEHEPYDSDWLNIHVRVTHPRGAWSKTDPCLLTYELAQLVAWLNSIAEDSPAHAEEEFLEPELRFEWFGEDKNILRVYLDYSLRPTWSPANEEEELFVEFAVTPEDLREAAASLRDDLQMFPVRVEM